MPVYNHFYLVQPILGGSPFHSGPLATFGPGLPVQINFPNALASLPSQQGKPVPTPVSGKALIDIGASITAVDSSVIQSLGVQPVGVPQFKRPLDPRNRASIQFGLCCHHRSPR